MQLLPPGTEVNQLHHASYGRRLLPTLFIGDALVVLLFVALGQFSHLTWSGLVALFPASFPFLLAWVLWGLILGTFRAQTLRSIAAAAKSALLAWALAAPTGVLVRMALLGRVSHWSFFLTAFAFGGAMLVVWRAIAAWIASRR
ncbi:MAG: hypothetical protein BAA04_05465 [Firmicutes bacterium ZCTH02-B6]|nr:MAG: hypothetical protein BAA04_05465 [Firmicutes bacterium ZCTH02-B6]